MPRNNEIAIDGYLIYIDQLEQLDTTSSVTHDAGGSKVVEWTTEQLTKAMRPAIAILDSIRNSFENNVPDEIELSMQFDLNLKGETPILKIISAESSSQIAVKFTWKS